MDTALLLTGDLGNVCSSHLAEKKSSRSHHKGRKMDYDSQPLHAIQAAK